MKIEHGLIALAAGLSIMVSLAAMSRGRRLTSQRGAAAARNSFYAQTADQAIIWNPNDQTNPNGMSAYNRRSDLAAPQLLIYDGKREPNSQYIPAAGVGGPSGMMQP